MFVRPSVSQSVCDAHVFHLGIYRSNRAVFPDTICHVADFPPENCPAEVVIVSSWCQCQVTYIFVNKKYAMLLARQLLKSFSHTYTSPRTNSQGFRDLCNIMVYITNCCQFSKLKAQGCKVKDNSILPKDCENLLFTELWMDPKQAGMTITAAFLVKWVHTHTHTNKLAF